MSVLSGFPVLSSRDALKITDTADSLLYGWMGEVPVYLEPSIATVSQPFAQP